MKAKHFLFPAGFCVILLFSGCFLVRPLFPDAPSPISPLTVDFSDELTPALRCLTTGSSVPGILTYIQSGSPVSIAAEGIIVEHDGASRISIYQKVASDRLPASPVLFYPVPDLLRIGEVPPAGGIYPADLHRGVLQLTWRRGAPAHALVKLASAGFEISYINIQRLYLELDTRSPDNPWGADWEAFSAGVVYSSASAAALNPGSLCGMEIVLPEKLRHSTWHMLNPFLPDILQETGTLLLPYTEGEQRFSAVSEKGEVLTVWTDGNNWRWISRKSSGGGNAEPAGWEM